MVRNIIKVDSVLAELLTQNRKDNGVLPSFQLNKYLEESPTYKDDLKKHIAKGIKEAPNAVN